MESDLNVQPLCFRRLYLAGKFYFKSTSLNNNTAVSLMEEFSSSNILASWKRKQNPLLTIVYGMFKEVKVHRSKLIDLYSLNTWVSNINLQDIIKVNISHIDRAKRTYDPSYLKVICDTYIHDCYSGFYKIFTDGSKDNSSAGAAFLDLQASQSLKFRIDGNISIMYIELIAILEALSYVASVQHDKLVILSDSKSALQYLARCTSNFRSSPVAYEILNLINVLNNQSKKIVLQWIPSHVKIVGNVMVDQLAKEACYEGIEILASPFYTDCFYLVKKKCYDLWTEYFDKRSKDKGIWYKTIQAEPYITSWVQMTNLNRKNTVIVLRLRSGHIPLNKFSYLMGKTSTPDCSVCGVVEDVYHILMECVRNEYGRRGYFGSLCKSTGGINILLSDPTSKFIIKLTKLYKIAMDARTLEV